MQTTPTPAARFDLRSGIPGLLLAIAVASAAYVVAGLEALWMGRVPLESLVLAILLGVAVRTAWAIPPTFAAGIRLASREVLEWAIVLLGLTVDLRQIVRAGPALAVGIVAVVVIGLSASYALGRALGLPHTLAVLVGCGNSICGNSAIAAVAPVIGAEAEQVSAAIAFTATLGIVVVLGLPLLIGPLHLSYYQYGVMTGLTVYAVPQVLAAAFPVSVLSGQVGTLVKLVRVLMLGPVVLFFAMRQRAIRARVSNDTGIPAATNDAHGRISQMVPPFVIGFLFLATLRSFGAVPAVLIEPARSLSVLLTVVAMAGLGLSSDVRAIARAGRPMLLAVTGSLVILGSLSLTLIHALHIR
jgi:uncharacterized integral membrane protein (TIGR00698 family)